MPRLLLTLLFLLSLTLTTPAFGGDEVDYSAPYLVVEDGELVTKYPNREHEAAAEPAGVGDSAATSAPGAADEANRGGLVAAALVGVIAGLLLIVRRRRRRSP